MGNLIRNLEALNASKKALPAHAEEICGESDIEICFAEGLDDEFSEQGFSRLSEVVTLDRNRYEGLLGGDGSLERLNQHPALIGFTEGRVSPLAEKMRILGVQVSRTDNHGDVRMFGMNQMENILPIQTRHGIVEQDALGRRFFNRTEGLEGILADLHFVASLPQKIFHGVEIQRIVVDDQDFVHGLPKSIASVPASSEEASDKGGKS